MSNNEKFVKMIRRYPVAVYIIILMAGILFILIPILELKETVWALLMNLGADFIGVTLIFFMLRFFFLDDKSSVNIEDIKDTLTNQILRDVSLHTPDKSYDLSQNAKKTLITI